VRKVTAGEDVSVDRRRTGADEQLGDAMFTGLRLNRGIELAGPVDPLRGRCLGALWPSPYVLLPGRDPAERGWPVAVDSEGDADGQ
jgi:hypothetical protein